MHHCPLCHYPESHHYFEDKRRAYLQCQQCELVFVNPEQRLDAKAEKAHYDLHENDPNDAGYRTFLSRVANPILERIEPSSTGLDFGCGPGPTLSLMMEEQGHNMSLYDLYYHPNTEVLERTYDFMTATEVIEHLYHPDQVWQQWLNLVKPGGWIGLMTKMVIDVEAFAKWHYKNDPTHVVFFSRNTFKYLAERDQLKLEFIGNDVILLRKTQ
ncbi:class I SAM-dependent methyltransferase [Vibrio sp. Isolate25]|uniref:class I SAM-dependent methyltransferase n=1 Tax=Vibrio TaxID=662 RepID=UPI001EFE42ED|nr:MULTISPECIES: class I SAM-dependent methyltransferase [Vibrio]MCG9598968.1 class I SAM-dependent methyltransferase [Vibrio sp. Isolate25]MCG9680261.1 class I SAM-dependent methyltransferase [Vibrio sp. Isolate24]USD32495.1 class I SAM-dependent methyltransferase [Vibrio sp. SCSIO 43186]USD45537.1 class I SAM-dependent methyltransferase [Vibrio sp. SCSIO 43145]USD69620.1 class I SAM-dependent methyltransferase [Vibrio sp. SCSIO 43139]